SRSRTCAVAASTRRTSAARCRAACAGRSTADTRRSPTASSSTSRRPPDELDGGGAHHARGRARRARAHGLGLATTNGARRRRPGAARRADRRIRVLGRGVLRRHDKARGPARPRRDEAPGVPLARRHHRDPGGPRHRDAGRAAGLHPGGADPRIWPRHLDARSRRGARRARARRVERRIPDIRHLPPPAGRRARRTRIGARRDRVGRHTHGSEPMTPTDTITSLLERDRAVLVLEDGARYEGYAYGARGTTLGEVVFTTGMTGYQETLTDPSYAGQIVLQTAPHIGNTGVNAEDPESRRIWVAGYIVRDPSRVVSNWRADESLDDALERDGIVGISGIDTRAVTRIIRSAGSMRGGIFSGDAAGLDADEQLGLVREAPQMAGQNLSADVSVAAAEVTPAQGEKVGNLAVLDLGVKQATVDSLAARGFEVHVLPQDVTFAELRAIDPVAVFYSNGPGDPAASDDHVTLLRA